MVNPSFIYWGFLSFLTMNVLSTIREKVSMIQEEKHQGIKA